MQRRAAGLVLVIITVIGVLMINAMAGRIVPGAATRPLAPAAPDAGSCLSVGHTGWTGTRCADPHTAEIVQSWSGSAGSQVGLYERCMAAGQVYLGDQWGQSGNSSAPVGWSVPPVMSSTVLVSGPGTTFLPGWSWQACVVRPILLGTDNPPGYRGRMRDVPATGVLPAELRPCFVRPGGLSVVGVSCSARHTGEVLAARKLQIFGDTRDWDTTSTSPEVNAECLGIARRVTAAADPTYGGRLQIVVNLHATGMGFVVSTESGGNASHSYVLYQARCALQTARPGTGLSASVVGLGTGPLPLA